jgi:hypothetical protein
MAPGCPTQVATKSKHECAAKIEKVRSKAFLNFFRRSQSFVCVNLYPGKTLRVTKTAKYPEQKVKDLFMTRSIPLSPKCNVCTEVIDKYLAMWKQKPYPQSSSDEGINQGIRNKMKDFHNIVQELGRKHFDYNSNSQRLPSGEMCETKGLLSTRYGAEPQHIALMAALNDAKNSKCY